jgi:hypothetical protein
MNKRRRAYKQYDWRKHCGILMAMAFREEVMAGKHVPIAGHGKSFVFMKKAKVGGKTVSLYCTLVGEKAITRMFEALMRARLSE